MQVLSADGLRIGRVLTSLVFIAGLLASVACGDDDDDNKKGDASTDAGPVVDSGGNFIPRRDASVAPTDPIADCDRFDPSSCPANLTCDVIVRLFAGQDQLTIYTGCVEKTRERGLGDPCDADFTTTTPYKTEGLTDLVFRDQCGPGLICAADPKVRGGTSCQPACASGSNVDDTGQPVETPTLCDDAKSFCVGSDFREYCHQSEGCDVFTQTGCPSGQNCYLRPQDDGRGLLGVCFPPDMTVTPDGQPCDAYNGCRPGSSCQGPLSKALSQWMMADYVCRPSCSSTGELVGGGVSDGDAGADDGGTASPATCAAPKKCSSFAASGLNLSSIQTPPYGQCE